MAKEYTNLSHKELDQDGGDPRSYLQAAPPACSRQAGLASRHRGKPSNRVLSAATRRTVLALVRQHYVDFGPSLPAADRPIGSVAR